MGGNKASNGLIPEDETKALVELHRKDIDEEPDGKTREGHSENRAVKKQYEFA